MAQYIRLFGEDQERIGTACNVFRIQIGCGVPVQGEVETKEEANSKFVSFIC